MGESYDVMQASSDDCYVINLISKFFSTTYDSANVNLNSIATTNLCIDIAIDWLLPYQHKDWFGVPIEAWNPPHYTDAYIPVKKLLCRCTHITEKVRHSHHYCIYFARLQFIIRTYVNTCTIIMTILNHCLSQSLHIDL